MQAFGPWEDSGTQTFQTAIHQGAQLGASLREQDLTSSDRMSQAYATLAQQEDLANKKAAADREQQTLDRQLNYAKLRHDNEKNDLLNYFRQAHLDEQAKNDAAQAASRSGNLDLRERQFAEKQAAPGFQAGPVQAFPVNDPETGKPIPELVATPSPTGKGMTVHLRKQDAASLSPNSAANLLKSLSSLEDASPGISTNLAPILRQRVESAVRGKPAAQPAVQSPKPKRVRVIGPGGKKGTIEEGDTLPEGWKLE